MNRRHIGFRFLFGAVVFRVCLSIVIESTFIRMFSCKICSCIFVEQLFPALSMITWVTTFLTAGYTKIPRHPSIVSANCTFALIVPILSLAVSFNKSVPFFTAYSSSNVPVKIEWLKEIFSGSCEGSGHFLFSNICIRLRRWAYRCSVVFQRTWTRRWVKCLHTFRRIPTNRAKCIDFADCRYSFRDDICFLAWTSAHIC